jgi:hypothetical protein
MQPPHDLSAPIPSMDCDRSFARKQDAHGPGLRLAAPRRHPRTTNPYDCTGGEIALDEVEWTVL